MDANAEPIVACTLSIRDLAAQADRWRALRAAAQTDRAETDDGLMLRFRPDPGVDAELRALAAAENECCSWARWDVRADTDGVVLHATSTGEGVAALHGMLV